MFGTPAQLIKNTLKNQIDTAVADFNTQIKNYIDAKDFINYPPKIGYFDEQYIPCFATYNMSWYSVWERPAWIVTDNRGREIMYFTASNGDPATPMKLYKAYRYSSATEFIYENAPVHPAYMNENSYPTRVCGLGNNYIAYKATVDGQEKVHLVITNGDSNYTTWTNYSDITQIAAYARTVIFFHEFNTIAILISNNLKQYLKLYNRSDLSLIREILLIDYGKLFDYNGFEFCRVWIYDEFGASSMAYIKSTEQLVLNNTLSLSYKKIGESTTYNGQNRRAVSVFSVPYNFFSNGIGEPASLIPLDQYKLSVDCSGITYDKSRGPWTVVYDEYDNTIRSCYKLRDTVIDEYWQVDANNRPLNATYLQANSMKYENLVAPDACPWSKIMYSPILMNDEIYLQAYSKKYGYKTICIKYEKDGTSPNLKIESGTWWITSQYETDFTYTNNIQCTRMPDGTTKWTYVYVGQAMKDVKVQDFVGTKGEQLTGKRSYLAAYDTVPVPPSNYIVRKSIKNFINGKYYYIAYDAVSSDPQKQGLCYLLEYDQSTNTYTEFRTLPKQWLDIFQSSYNHNGTSAQMWCESNVFVDNDGIMYFALYATWPGDATYAHLFSANRTQADMEIKYCFSMGSIWTKNLCISYDKNFGYVAPVNGDFNRAIIRCSKDFVNGGPEKTKEEFFADNAYTVYITLKPSAGLAAFTQTTQVFIGGYLRTIQQTEIPLYPNSDNYIYLSASETNRDAVDILVSTNYPQIQGAEKHSKALIAKITTNDRDAISQTEYRIPG